MVGYVELVFHTLIHHSKLHTCRTVVQYSNERKAGDKIDKIQCFFSGRYESPQSHNATKARKISEGWKSHSHTHHLMTSWKQQHNSVRGITENKEIPIHTTFTTGYIDASEHMHRVSCHIVCTCNKLLGRRTRFNGWPCWSVAQRRWHMFWCGLSIERIHTAAKSAKVIQFDRRLIHTPRCMSVLDT